MTPSKGIAPGVLPAVGGSIEWLYRYRNDIWSFASECCFTLDEANKQEPIKPFCVDGAPESEYLEYMIRQISDEFLLALVKHRRMRMTWAAALVTLHDAMFFEGRRCALISKKEDDSDDLVKKVKFIYEHIPRDKMPVKPRMSSKFCKLEFPDQDSVVMGLASGADQLRQYTMSRIVADEIAFWPKAKETFVGMKPTLQGGGKVLLLSTRYPGFFKNIIDDNIDEDEAA